MATRAAREENFYWIFFLLIALVENQKHEQIEEENQQNWVNRSKWRQQEGERLWLAALKKKSWKAFYFFLFFIYIFPHDQKH